MIEIVYLQTFDGGASAGCFADDFGFVGGEIEMLVPDLSSRIEEFDGFSSEIINGFGFGGFVGVAFAAGEPEIFFDCLAACGLREDVFDFEFVGNQFLRVETITATAFRLAANLRV